MSKNYLSIDLGGASRGLKYNMAALEVIVELTGNTDLGMVVTKDLVVNIYAGMVGNYAVQDKDPDFDIKDIKKWVGVLEFEEATALNAKVEECILSSYPRKEPASQEGSADTQRQALNVA